MIHRKHDSLPDIEHNLPECLLKSVHITVLIKKGLLQVS